MNITTTTTAHPSTRHRSHRRRRLALPLIVGAALALGACGSDDDKSVADSVETAVDITVPPVDASGAAGTEPAKACGLFATAAVDVALGTTGVTASPDTSLGLFDGCRWATARTDVPALLLGYDPAGDFDQLRGLACDGTTPEPVVSAGADAVACFGVLIAPAGAGVVLVSIDDPLDQWDDAVELGLASQFALAAS